MAHVPSRSPTAERSPLHRTSNMCLTQDVPLMRSPVVDQVNCAQEGKLAPDIYSSMSSVCKITSVHRAETVISKNMVAIASIGIVVTVTIVFVVVAWSKRGKSNIRQDPMTLCGTPDCLSHALSLKTSLDTGVDPCDDFNAFVCGNSLNEALAQTLRYRRIMATLRRLNSADASHLQSTAIAKARRLFATCSSTNLSGSVSNVIAFEEFVHSHNLALSESGKHEVHPLDLVLELAIAWGICMWIKIEIMRKERVILVSWCEWPARRLEEMQGMSQAQHESYVQKLCAVSTKLVSCKENVIGLLQDEKLILSTLLTNYTIHNQKYFALNEINVLTPSISSGTWTDLLSKHLKPTFPLTDYMMLARDLNVLKSIDSAFQAVSQQRLLSQIRWTFLQMRAWTVVPSVHLIKVGRPEEITRIRAIQCLDVVENTMGLLLDLEDIHKEHSNKSREDIDTMLDTISNMTVRLLIETEWLDEKKVVTAIAKLALIRRDVWPASIFYNVTGLDELYSAFPSMSDEFFVNWIKSREAMTSTLIRSAYNSADVFQMRHDNIYGLFFYLNYVNIIQVSLSAFHKPLYYTNGTVSMNYGALGGRYALEFLKGLYNGVVGIEHANETDMLAWLLPSRSNRSETGLARDCFEGQGLTFRNMFPFVPALQVAHRIFKNKQKLHVNDWKLQLLEEYSTDQIFFLTFCNVLCHFSNACNAAVSNLDEFATAFHCLLGSNMNPKKKCSFFREDAGGARHV
ncbi:neprilysin-1-like [Ornithodoros turicata]|uniref:neprilysin-1-like n=1 Tax=Ornithodoros turicata TaxID=34597 RepID=UPI00313A319E